MRVSTGNQATFEADFLTEEGSPAILQGEPSIIFTLDEVPAFSAAPKIITETSAGTWRCLLTVPEDAMPGWYEAKWSAVSEGDTIEGAQFFEVVVGTSTILNDEFGLRRRLRDSLKEPPSDDGAFFLNDEIHTLLASNGGNVIAAAYDGWMIRAAHYSTLVDISESGSDRRLSQMFKNAMAMADFYKKARDGDTGAKSAAMAGRVVGSVVNLRGEYMDTFGIVASANYRSRQARGAYVRIFPLNRFMGTLSLLPAF